LTPCGNPITIDIAIGIVTVAELEAILMHPSCDAAIPSTCAVDTPAIPFRTLASGAHAARMKYVKTNHLMGIYRLINIALVATGILYPGWLGLWAIFCTSFFMSVMYPTIFALGKKTKIGTTGHGASVPVHA
jgi:hypothetical protein